MFNYIFHVTENAFYIDTPRDTSNKSGLDTKTSAKNVDLETLFIYLYAWKCARENYPGFYHLIEENVWTTKSFCLSKKLLSYFLLLQKPIEFLQIDLLFVCFRVRCACVFFTLTYIYLVRWIK